MAFQAVDDFESYGVGSLSGGAGGSGWSGNWTGTLVNVVSSPTYTGTRAASNNSTTGGDTTRAWTAVSSGTIYVSMRCTGSTTGDQQGITLIDGVTTNRILLFFNQTAGNISYWNGASYTVLQAFTTNTWYRIGIQWDNANHPNQAAYNVNNGAFTAFTNVNGNFSTLSGIDFNIQSATAANTFFWDDINFVYAPATTPTLPYRALMGVGI